MLANDPITQARIDLTTALRAAVRHGLNEGCYHFSSRPQSAGAVLVSFRAALVGDPPPDLVMPTARATSSRAATRRSLGLFIHSRLHAGNPRAKVVHSMPYVTALTSIRDGRLEMCTQNWPLLEPRGLRRSCAAR